MPSVDRICRSKNTQVEVVFVVRAAEDPVTQYTSHPDYQPRITDINKLWTLYHTGILPQDIKPKEKEIFATFENTTSYGKTKALYMVQLPSKFNKEIFSNNYGLALDRQNVTKKFIKNPS